ncbi:hypothetical protein K435DRAFT_98972 [Dendrothele bispora CBS 962.96]|uniref:Uncharacterized protein n=1 Tax=Dendrothele bispora (strain CBS 962.96) TaxID=1314807 RepID=A0A4S8KNS0_DENBC|nr:hypothetical protein K435DRAFT_98972 [Dendrothele bispora CBS 962.96]
MSDTIVVGADDGPWLARMKIPTVLKGRPTVLASLSVPFMYIRDLFDLAIKAGKLDRMTSYISLPLCCQLLLAPVCTLLKSS